MLCANILALPDVILLSSGHALREATEYPLKRFHARLLYAVFLSTPPLQIRRWLRRNAVVWSQYTARLAARSSCHAPIAAGADLDLGLVAADSVGPRPPHPTSSHVVIIGTLIF